MLPNTNDKPPKTVQFAAYKPIPLAIGGDFGIPEFPVAAGSPITFWASVPKAAVHKDNNPRVPEGEIRLAQKRLVAPPAGDAVLAKYLD